MGELCLSCGIKNDTLKKYGKPVLGFWIGRGKRGKQFTLANAVKIVTAVQNGSSESAIKLKCSNWLNEIRTKSENPN